MSTNSTDEHASGASVGGPGYTPHGTHLTTTASGEQPEARTNTGNQVSGGIKGAWNVFHGAGEALRGNINSVLDGVGENIAGRGGKQEQTHPIPRSGETSSDVAARGQNEFSRGLDTFNKH